MPWFWFSTNSLVYPKPSKYLKECLKESSQHLHGHSMTYLWVQEWFCFLSFKIFSDNLSCISSKLHFSRELRIADMANLVLWMVLSGPSVSSWNVYNSVSNNQWQLVVLWHYAVFSVTRLPSPNAKMNFINSSPSAGTIITWFQICNLNMQYLYTIL